MKFDECQPHRKRFANEVHANDSFLDSGCSKDEDVNKLR